MASIRKLKSGRWQAVVRRKGHQPACKTFTKKALAERWARITEEEIQSGMFVDPRSAQNVTLRELMERYRLDVLSDRPPSDPEHYRLTALQTRLGHFTPLGLKALRVVEYAQARLADVTSDSVRRELTLLGGVIRRAMTLWGIHLSKDPVKEAARILKEMRVLEPGAERSRRLRPGEEERLLGVPTTQPTSIKEIIRFALETAMRRSEIAQMRFEHIDWESSTLVIPKSKSDWKTGRVGREIPLTKCALGILRARPERDDGLVWGVKAGSISRAFERLCARGGLEDLRFHDLRHEATSRLFERNYSIQEVATITGHRDWRSIKRYTHIQPDALARKLAQESMAKN